jgi:hypothetical protein
VQCHQFVVLPLDGVTIIWFFINVVNKNIPDHSGRGEKLE